MSNYEPTTGGWKTRVSIYQERVLPHLGFDPSDYLLDHCFFGCPASTRFHGAYEGGLFDHSMVVMETLLDLTEKNGLEWDRPESPYIVGFFHDLCKIDQYDHNPNAMEPGQNPYTYNPDTLYEGHGDKSVILLSALTRLTEEEAACIRYHMGAYTEKEKWNFYGRAIERFPNVLWTHHADMIASKIKGV